MKKIFALLLVLVMTMGLLTSCGQETSAPAAGGEKSDAGATAPEAGGSSQAAGSWVCTASTTVAEGTFSHTYLVAFKEYVEAQTNGAITVNIYPNGQLAADREALESIQNNEITMTATAVAPQVNFVPDVAIWDIPFTFSDVEALRYTMNDPVFLEAIRKSYDQAGYRLLGYADTDFRILSCNKEIHSPSDLNGVIIRTMENENHMTAWRAMGASPTPLAFNELYTALQQGTVDGQENPLELIYTSKFYEQQKYIIKTNHLGQCVGFVMSKEWYESLPAEFQTVIDTAHDIGIEAAYKYLYGHESYEDIITDYGCTVIDLSPEEQAEFSAIATPAVQELVSKTVSAEVYDAFFASIDSYKNQ